MLVIATACESRDELRPPPQPHAAPDPIVRIEALPRFAQYRDADSPYDCTAIAALQAYLPATRVESCGLLERDATPEAMASLAKCAKRVVEAKQPVVFAQEVQGTDSAVVRAYLARVEAGRYAGYHASYASDPCGGSCGEYGGTYIVRCDPPAALAADCHDERLAACLACDGAIIERCRNGAPSAIPLAAAEQARDALVAATPTHLGPAFGPLDLGAPSAGWETPEAGAVIQRIQAGGIVWIETDRRPRGPTIDAIVIQFAGPCHRARAAVIAKWGEPKGGWIDVAAHRRAYFSDDACALRVETYADVAAWLGDAPTAILSTGLIGMSVKELAKRTGGELTESRVSWKVPGIGRATGGFDVDASATRGRVTGVDFRGVTDPATIAALRAHLTRLRGRPTDDGVWRGRGRPPITVRDFDGELSITIGE